MIRAVVVMGVSGSGKSTLGQALAQALGWRFVEGDALHPEANIAKMSAGIPLNDADRRPFLDSVAAAIADGRREGVVVACSALKRTYRDRIRGSDPNTVFVLPRLSREQLQQRLGTRTGHFLPSSLLDSQLTTLEPLQPDEMFVQTQGAEPLEIQVQAVVTALKALSIPILTGHA